MKYPSKRYRGVDLMGLAAEESKHGDCLGFVMGFAEHLTVQPDDGVGCDEQLVGLELGRVRLRFRARYIIRNVSSLQFRRIGLIGVDVNRRKRQVETCH